MKKISSQEAQSLLKTAASTIRALQEENSSLKTEKYTFEKEARVRRLATEMEEKGLHGDLNFEEKVAHLREVPSLEITEEAVKMAAPQNGGFASLSDQPGVGASSALETYILTGESGD